MNQLFDKRDHLGACRQLPIQVDLVRLQNEVRALPVSVWVNNRARVHQDTKSVFLKGFPPRLGIAGDPEQPELALCPYIRELLYGVLPGTSGKCLLASLSPNSIVYPHTDTANEYFVRSFRFHIPIFTNEKVHFYCGGKFFHMREGEVWTVNNLLPHAVINDHPAESRIHLIFDVFPDTEGIGGIDRLPESPGHDDAVLFRRLENAAQLLLAKPG